MRSVESSSESEASLTDDSKDALLRFARFIKKDKEDNRDKEGKPSPGTVLTEAKKFSIPIGYSLQVQLTQERPNRGAVLDIYI